MSGFQITITDAGRAALINAQNNGTVAFVLSQVGVSTQHVAANLTGLTQLPNERKRLATMAGDVVADDTLHVTIRDEGDDAYAIRAFGIYTSAAVLFAVYSQPEPILEKSAAAMLLLAVDARLVALGTAMVEFGPADFSMPPASETVAGVVEIATDAEVDAGLDPWRVITARTLKRALGALSGFALLGHKHDAADTTSGVFHVGRIPALDMSKITGLANALAGKAAEVHTHTINQITGLVDALAGKAATVHQHVADDIVSGVLAVARIPVLGMEKITGLVVALASKANVQNPDFWGQFNLESGPSRLRAIGDGDSLFLQAGTATSNNGNLILSGLFGQNLTSCRVQMGGGLHDILHKGILDPARLLGYRPEHDHLHPNDRPRGLSSGDTDIGSGLKGWAYWTHMRPGNTYGAQIAVSDTAEEVWVRRKSDSNWQAWHQIHTTATFNPADKAPALHSHNWAQVTGKPSLATTDGSGVFFGAWNLGLAVQVNGSDWRYLPTAQHVDTIIDWRGATNAETHAGALGNKFVSPTALWSFARSIGPNGYIQIPGTPLIMQWGVRAATVAEGPVDSYLPVAFGGGCLFASATPRNASGVVTMDFYMQVMGRWQDRISWYANRANGSAGNMSGFEWMAIGLATGNPDPAYYSGGGGGGGGGGELNPEL